MNNYTTFHWILVHFLATETPLNLCLASTDPNTECSREWRSREFDGRQSITEGRALLRITVDLSCLPDRVNRSTQSLLDQLAFERELCIIFLVLVQLCVSLLKFSAEYSRSQFQRCANAAASRAASYLSFDPHYQIAEDQYVCKLYAQSNTDSSYFNLTDANVGVVHGFSGMGLGGDEWTR